MKKITLFSLLGLAVLTAGSLFAKEQRIWSGVANRLWSLTDANWVDPNSDFTKLGIILPVASVDSATAMFDDSTDSLKVKVVGRMIADSILVNSTKNYLVDVNATGAEIAGKGILIKRGSGTFEMNVLNSLLGGTIIYEGKVKMLNTTSPNIYGASLTFQGGTANFAASTASTYPAVTVPIIIPTGVTATVELNRYSYWSSPITGGGDLVIGVGGERCMLGTSKTGSVPVNWSKFTGNVTLQRTKVTGAVPGYYGLLLPSTKAYDYTNMTTVDSLFWNRKVMLKSGAGFAACSGTHCWAIGELQAENDSSFLTGYGAGASSSPYAYYMVGCSNTDVVFPGTITDAGGKGYNYVGIVKYGTGKYTFTSTKSITTASVGVLVKQGTFLVNIPVTSTTTALGRVTKANALTINANAIGGGNGRITGKVQVDSLGTLVVGVDGIGKLALADTLTGKTVSSLLVKNGGKVIFKIASKTSFDNISTNSTATFNGGTILLKAASGISLNDNDSMVIMTTASRVAVDSFLVKTEGFPTGITLTCKKDTIAGSGNKFIAIAHVQTGLNTLANNVKLSMYPNPAKGNVHFTSNDAEIRSIEVLNLQGQVLSRNEYNSTSVTVDIEKLVTGIYYAKIKTTKGSKIEKLIIE